MSASEKLKALEAKLREFPNGQISAESERMVLLVLPQIVAVVKTAEKGAESWNELEPLFLDQIDAFFREDLRPALAALDEAL